jgi:hypothetical protein
MKRATSKKCALKKPLLHDLKQIERDMRGPNYSFGDPPVMAAFAPYAPHMMESDISILGRRRLAYPESLTAKITGADA